MKQYIQGFIISIILTLGAYFLVVNETLMGWNLIFVIVGLALIQLCVQLIFFLHLGAEKNPHWNLAAFISTASVILILVIGSLWIMKNLNYNHTPTEDIIKNEGINR